jgi:hypothetical protein
LFPLLGTVSAAQISELQSQLTSLQTEQAQCNRTAAAAAAAVQSIKVEPPASPRSPSKRAVVIDALHPAVTDTSAAAGAQAEAAQQPAGVTDTDVVSSGPAAGLAAPRLSLSLSTKRSRSIHVPGSLEDRVRVMEQQVGEVGWWSDG